ncbi:atypical/RIO/RIO1 protein kinase [Pseudozyma hubeiensis SY62]|uniref:Atypical/RIO/RIO1 protein kinase n=1 Tax=Pseudozyma hubeiensis (strain SY62) TaxID=1305764 RepID=R9NWW4_PSEHS|nr:atypical/RIO/RIO1 protein kinase [Pseudozyma hubeiensis SY62]GAC93049.1 atypical/RIO/RIO1 protein kinase [Pseudozyma hubeiensis SY62]
MKLWKSRVNIMIANDRIALSQGSKESYENSDFDATMGMCHQGTVNVNFQRMLLRPFLLAACINTLASRVLCRPTGSDRDWEVGRSPTSGLAESSFSSNVIPWSSDGSSSSGTKRPFSPDPWTREWFDSPSVPQTGIFGLRDSGWKDIPHEAGASTAPDHEALGPQNEMTIHDNFATSLVPTSLDRGVDAQLHSGRSQQPAPLPLMGPLVPNRGQAGESFKSHALLKEGQHEERSGHVGTSSSNQGADPMPAEPLSSDPSVLAEERQLHKIQKTPAARMARARAELNRVILNTNKRTAFSGSATNADKWQHRMREVLGSEDVKILPIQQPAGITDRVFIAKYTDPTQAMPSAASVPRSWQMDSYGLLTWGHFLSLSKQLKVQRLSQLVTGSQWKRLYVYLNSDAKRAYINQHYFNNLVRWLPINENELHWTGLNKLHLGRQVQYVLPPSDGHDMALILDRHDRPQNGVGAFVARMTGTTDLEQSVSVWSPALFDGERYTFILYGVGQIKQDRVTQVLGRLEALQKTAETNKIAYTATRDIADLRGAGHLV